MSITSINPVSGDALTTYDELSEADACRAVEETHDVFLQWRTTPYSERADRLRRAATVLRDRAGDYAELMAREMGKPVSEGRAESEKCAWVCEYYADNAEEFLKDQVIETDAERSFVTFQPLGVLLAVMPWNFPFWQVFRFAAPALMGGNAAVLKHASNVPGCALAIQQVFEEAGFPKALFRTLLIGSDSVDAVLSHRLVRAVTLTGSTPAGRAVAETAGRLLKKSVLELGGSDPYLILADADIQQAAATCVKSRLINSGQSCIAAKRFLVLEPVREAFENAFVEKMASIRMGDPCHEDTEVGPQAREDLRDELHEQVRKSVKQGARCLLGGEVPEGPGAFYPPTVLTDVQPGMPAFDEELFGPVAAIVPVRDEQEAIDLANRSRFGLGAAVFTRDIDRGTDIATRQLEAGACFVNDFVKSDPRLPFGGIKESGYGRELSHFGIMEFLNIKTVYVA